MPPAAAGRRRFMKTRGIDNVWMQVKWSIIHISTIPPNFWQIAITLMAVLAEFKEGGQRRVAQKVLFARIMEVRSNQIGVPPNKAYDDEYLFMVGRQG